MRRCVRRVTVATRGGDLLIDWPAGGEMLLIGPAERLTPDAA
ncbi:hypothetical protein LzC2_40190 [Planctomycetes bacterium LzC2]|uniref:Uncharacterized protein n=1 Tax=Alienimonas chondri TaxID=2681879 RepID=A0ABX1VLF2_9PLAN|nr:hypothetical protein [Alienimonas chondri]